MFFVRGTWWGLRTFYWPFLYDIISDSRCGRGGNASSAWDTTTHSLMDFVLVGCISWALNYSCTQRLLPLLL